MYQSWVDASRILPVGDGDIWAVDFTAHPLLDPDFPRKRSRQLHLMRLTYRRILQDDEAYRRELVRLFYPPDSDLAAEQPLARLAARASVYLQEADVYLASIIELLPGDCGTHVLPLPRVTDCDDVRELIGLSFHGQDERLRFEARRKLFLAQTLLQIEQSRHIQDGPRHMQSFENVLNEGLWRYSGQIHDLSIGFRMGPDGRNIQYTSRPDAEDQTWHFRSTFVEKRQGGRSIALDILYYSCRFKRSVTPVTFEIVDGQHRVLEKMRWGDMKQQSSGSILSKMIRKGINNPDEISDLIGAMFIVNDNEALNDLLILLDSCIGSPLGWRNVTDTLAQDPGSTLNDFSSRDFKVLKGDVDILAEEPGGGPPYRFPVEIQIFTLEGYLRTVCGAHDASHLAMKLRQFLYGLVPRVFPRAVYGSRWLTLEAAAGGNHGGGI